MRKNHPPQNRVCLWYDSGALDAAVLTVEFTVSGIPCLGLNGGPSVKHNCMMMTIPEADMKAAKEGMMKEPSMKMEMAKEAMARETAKAIGPICEEPWGD